MTYSVCEPTSNNILLMRIQQPGPDWIIIGQDSKNLLVILKRQPSIPITTGAAEEVTGTAEEVSEVCSR